MSNDEFIFDKLFHVKLFVDQNILPEILYYYITIKSIFQPDKTII